MRKIVLVLFFIFFILDSYSQEKDIKHILKAEYLRVSDLNFYQLAFETDMNDKKSLQFGIGYGSLDNISLYSLHIQIRFYLIENAPHGLYVGPKVFAAYIKDNNRDYFTSSKPNTIAYEVDAIIGYQFLISNSFSIDPYMGAGFANVYNQNTFGFIYGITFGIPF